MVVESPRRPLSLTEFFCYHQGLLNKTEIESDTEFEVPALAAR